MSGASRAEPLLFEPAPVGQRVRVIGLLVAALFPMIVALQFWFVPRSSGPGYWIAILAPLIGAPIVAVGWLASAIRRYRLSGDELLIEQAWRTVRFPLAGLAEARLQNNVLSGARKRFGNDGLGAVVGVFRDPRGEMFRAFLSDPERAVMLVWPDQRLAVSPQRPGEFLAAVKQRTAGLRARA